MGKLLLALVTIAAVVSPARGQDCSISAVFWRYNMPGQEDFYRDLAAGFSKAYPGCRVDVSLEEWTTAHAKLARWAGGEPAPDITVAPDVWLSEFRPALWLYPKELDQAFLDKFDSRILARAQTHGQLLGLPWACSTKALFVRSDLLKSAGLNMPKTWDQLLQAALAIKKTSGLPGIAIPGAPALDSADNFYIFLWTNGAELRSGNGHGIVGEKAYEAISFYRDLALKDKVTQSSLLQDDRPAVEKLFLEGKVGMVFSGPWLIQLIAEKNPKLSYRVVPFPQRSNAATQLVTDHLVVLSVSHKREAALRFIQFAYQTEWRKRWAKLGMVPELRTVLSDPEIRDNAVWSPFLTDLPDAHWVPMVPWEEADRSIRQSLSELLAGQKTGESALRDMNVVLQRVEGGSKP